MKRYMVALALGCVAAVSSGCSPSGEKVSAPAPAPAEASPAASTTPGVDAGRASPPPATPAAPVAADAATAAAVGAPDFAVLYPGAVVDAPAVTATGASGPGGMVTYKTQADADAVVSFYRQRAEAVGLSSVMAMNQGEARAYGAAGADAGATLQVVASPASDGSTSVQLSWSARR